MASTTRIEPSKAGVAEMANRSHPEIDLSIIIVNWNTRELTRQCLRSLREACDGLRTEIIVVDNASADGSTEMVELEFPEARLIRNPVNAGFAKGNNIGLRIAAGRYIALINSDVTVPPGCLQTVLGYMNQNPAVGMSGPKMLTPGREVGASCMRRPSLAIWLAHALGLSSRITSASLHMEKFYPDGPEEVDVLNGWFWLVRKEALDKVGFLDEQFFMYGEDIDWCHRFWDQHWKIVYLPQAEAVHYGGGSSARAPVRFYVEMQRANMQYWRRYHNRLSQIAYVVVVALHQTIRVIGYAAMCVVRPSSNSDALFKVQRSLACLRWLIGLPNSD